MAIQEMIQYRNQNPNLALAGAALRIRKDIRVKLQTSPSAG